MLLCHAIVRSPVAFHFLLKDALSAGKRDSSSYVFMKWGRGVLEGAGGGGLVLGDGVII